MDGERGQATVEWTALVLLVALVLAGAVAAGARVDGRSFGGLLAHVLVCAARAGCDEGDAGLARAYGREDAALVRAHAPNLVYEPGVFTLPVDFRTCRRHACSDAPDDRALDVHSSVRTGARATVFTRVVRRGRETFLQYWLYYPDSTTSLAGSQRALRALTGGRDPLGAHHLDDWESYQVRVDAEGRAWSRASSHHGYRSCKLRKCRTRWLPATGWTRVSRGSHAGHVPWELGPRLSGASRTLAIEPRRPLYPGVDLRERTTTAAGLRLVPLETLDRDAYESLDPGVSPPWRKRVYSDPLSDGTS
jgi:hypothetical protein